LNRFINGIGFYLRKKKDKEREKIGGGKRN
jgi:hypothetical protein